ncbi:MAG: hypothetical protein KF889_28510 [Alphaproteobacteria bacterium]|nr:hypothetical protein [Alphaproteobacteria bacterium]MCW5743045.1 hypothetical protein [Alphaproteobacteria bacterium]
MPSIRLPLVGALLLSLSALPAPSSAQPLAATPPVLTPADCVHPTPPVRVATRILCSAVVMTRLAQRIDESARALRLSITPDERSRFDEDQAAWLSGSASACQADGTGDLDPAREVVARDCLLVRFSNRLAAMRHMVGTWRAAVMRDCAYAARALSAAIPAQRTVALTSRIRRYEDTAAALRYLAHAHSAEFVSGSDVETRLRAEIAAEGEARVAQRVLATLAECDKKHDTYQGRVPATPVAGPANPATQPPQTLAALAPSPIRALCNGLAAEREALDRCMTRKAVAYYEGRLAEAGRQAVNGGVVPHPQTHETWASYRDRHCSWSVAHVSDEDRVSHHDRCLLSLAARRDLELRDALAARERYRAPTPAKPADKGN